MPLVDVSLLFTPISLMICMTSFPGTWVESLMRCRGWLSPAESAARDRLQTAGSTAGWVSRTRDTEGHCHALAPLPKRMTGTGRGKYSDSQPVSQTSPIIFIWYSIWLAMLALFSRFSRLLWYKIFTRGCRRRCTERREGQVSELSRPGEFLRCPVGTDQVSGARYGQCPLCHCHHDHSLRLNQDNPSNCKTGMRFK